MIKNAIFSIFVIGLFAASAVTGQVTPPTGMIGWWAGDGDFRDSSGNGLNATPASGASPTFLVGKVGQGFTTPGTQYATIPDSPALRPQSFTIEGWARLSNADGNTKVFFAKPLGASFFDSFALFAAGATLRGAVCNNTGCITLTAPITINAWHHIAFSYDDPGGAATKTARLYLNGAVVATDTTGGAIGYDTRPAVIGADINSGAFSEGWVGGIDEVALYNRALALTEIQSINTAGINGKTKQAATSAGANSQTVVNDATITFDNVSTGGTTTDFTIDPATVGTLPNGYLQAGLAYDISTTSIYSGNIQLCLALPSIAWTNVNSIHIFHREGAALIERTSSRNGATNTVCATVSSLSAFVVATGSLRYGQIVYSRTPASASVDGTIWAISPNGTDDHQLTTGSFPRLSPDALYLAFKRKSAATTDPNTTHALWVLNLRTGVETRIFNLDNSALVGFDFTPDSLKIVVDQGCSIFQINRDGTGLTTLSAASCFDDAPVSRSGDGRLAFHSSSGTIYTSNANGSNRALVPNVGSGHYYPMWSKDGQFFAYIHYDGSSPHPYYADSLYKIKPDGTGKVLLKTLTGVDRFGYSGTWSADGTQIYLPARIGGVTGIYAVATDGSGTVTLADSSNLIAAGANVEFVGAALAGPTAAGVSVSGRVATADGRGIRNVSVSMTDQRGNVHKTLTSSLGFYRFDEIEAGQTVVFSIAAKRYVFASPTRIVTVQEELADIDFTAEPQ